MPDPILFKADDGSVQQVVESETLTLEDIDKRIAESQDHLQYLQNLRVQVDVLQNGVEAAPADAPADPATPVDDTAAPAAPEAPAAGGVELTVTPGTPGEQPVVDPAAAPADANTAALNNAQVDPAASSNPTPAVPEQPAPVAAPVDQPIVGA